MSKLAKRPTHEEVRRLLRFDQETGHLYWRVDRCLANGHVLKAAGDRAGSFDVSTGYRQISIGRRFLEHIVIVFWMTGQWPSGREVDHRNTNRADNRWDNLRVVPKAINAQNLRRVRIDSKTGFQGVQFHKKKGKFVARLKTGGKNEVLGYHDCAESAHQQYLDAKRARHAGCTI